MELIFRLKSEFETEILVGKISNDYLPDFMELLPELSENEIKTLNSFKSEKRKSEWISVRMLVKFFFNTYREIKYTTFGKPFFDSNFNISISHTSGFVAIIISKNNEIGIDIEKIDNKILKIAEKFIFKKELDSFPISLKKEMIYLNWNCKETLFKIYEKGKLDFKTNLIVQIDDIKEFGKINSIIRINDNDKNIILNYKFLSETTSETNLLLVWYP